MRKVWRSVAVAASLILATILVLANGRQPQPFSAQTDAALRLQPGPLTVLQYDQTFIDPSRPTAANGDYAGEAARSMEGTVWHPGSADKGPYPLIVYSHGFTSNRMGGAYLAEQLASLGYVVVAVNYPLTNFEAPGGPNVKDVVNQPADISFLIDTLIEASKTSGEVLEGMVDETRIGVTGISLGGMTTTLVSFHPDMRDPRIGAALSIAGPTATFTEVFFTHAKLPFLMLAGDIDALVPYASNAAPVPAKVAGGELITVSGASHTGFAGPAAPLRWMNNPDALGCWMVMNRIGEAPDQSWHNLLGAPELGIDYDAKAGLCEVEPLPEAMNVLRQQMITSVVVSSFFQSHFAPTGKVREAAQEFLSDTLAREVGEVNYRNSVEL
ncbi:MAG: hypothetical protein HOC23_15675 [Halieaceae bacterium]|jgi:predicted dienelactone hydrolase|nr:hypothetical protein [Halieaceae bacterium]